MPDAGPFQRSIGYREYVFMGGCFQIAFGGVVPTLQKTLPNWLIGIQSLGKRGSFVQITDQPQVVESLPEGFTLLDGTLPDGFSLDSLPQEVDDASKSLNFERANIYSGEKITLGKERLLHLVLLPYRRTGASRGYTVYTRSGHVEENP
jgi:hypothetical protein